MKKFILSPLVIVLAIGFVGGGVLAYFQGTETSTGNSFQAVTFDLKIRDQDEEFRDGVTATWTIADMAPGDGPALGEVQLHIKAGSIKADHLEITCDYAITSETIPADEMASVMLITLMRYYKGDKNVDLLTDDGYDMGYDVSPGEAGPKVEDVDEDGRISLYDLKCSQDGKGIDDLRPPYGVWHFEMELKFAQEAGNEFQGKTLNLTVIFTLNQHSSQ